MHTKDSDGKLIETVLAALPTESTLFSDTGEAMTPTQSPQDRRAIGEFHCRVGAFVGGEKPHFLFSAQEGWGRFFLTDTQIASIAEDCSSYIGDLVRAREPKR